MTARTASMRPNREFTCFQRSAQTAFDHPIRVRMKHPTHPVAALAGRAIGGGAIRLLSLRGRLGRIVGSFQQAGQFVELRFQRRDPRLGDSQLTQERQDQRNDADTMRRDPMLKLAMGRLPDDADLCSQAGKRVLLVDTDPQRSTAAW